MSDKISIHKLFLNVQDEKVDRLKNELAGLAESAKNETKSSAGDKHETALAHLQSSTAQLSQQLEAARGVLTQFKTVDPYSGSATGGSGSLVRTDKNIVYLSAAVGKIKYGAFEITAISPASPLGRQLIGKTNGDNVIVNSRRYVILEIT